MAGFFKKEFSVTIQIDTKLRARVWRLAIAAGILFWGVLLTRCGVME